MAASGRDAAAACAIFYGTGRQQPMYAALYSAFQPIPRGKVVVLEFWARVGFTSKHKPLQLKWIQIHIE
jgi:hypothetical protein